ncbi:MAG: glycosyltransferase family 2 protein [Planctomycetes bacterium]|nr:glycosyltransferase family 2 protein [Planctomycetota bacterium]
MDNPLVSVVVAVYNGESFLDQALESVLNQSYRNFEVIIVDDGSTDGTAKVAEPYLKQSHINYIYQSNSGHAGALNTGVSNTGGEFIAFIDHDDLWDLKKLQLQMDVFGNDPDLDVVFTHWKNFTENTDTEKFKFQKEAIKGYTTGTMLIRRNSFLKLGFFDTDLRKGYFFPWFDRLKMLTLKKYVMPELLYHRRIHGQNISIGSDTNDYKDYFLAIRKIRAQRDQ